MNHINTETFFSFSSKYFLSSPLTHWPLSSALLIFQIFRHFSEIVLSLSSTLLLLCSENLCVCVCVCVCVLVAQWCPTLCTPRDCGSPDSSVHGTLSRQYWHGLPFPSPRDLPSPGMKSASLVSPTLAGG